LSRPEPSRQYAVPGTWGYVDRIGVPAGSRAQFHVNAPSAYEFSVVRLGREAILDPGADGGADRDDVEVLAQMTHERSSPQTIGPGSYIYLGGGSIPSAWPITLAAWVRLWRLPVIDSIQWAWYGLITDLDYPDACRFGLIVDQAGRPAVYAGDGGLFRHDHLHLVDHRLDSRLGDWVHVAASIDAEAVRLFIDGEQVYQGSSTGTDSAPGPNARLRIGASAERGEAADFLDGDIAAPFVGGFALTADQARSIFRDRAHTAIPDFHFGPVHGWWPLAEEQGRAVADGSGNGRHGQLVNGGTWQIGGPAHDPAKGVPGYEPSSDPDRGHGLRLSSDDLVDCEWPTTDTFDVLTDADSGLYAARVRLVGQAANEGLTIPFAVVRSRPRRPDSLALLLSTNTWLAYGRRPADEVRVAGLAASFYSNHLNGRPFFQIALRAPIPRADPYGFDSPRAAYTGSTHLVRPERYAEAWLAREGFQYEAITDQDLHEDPDLLRHFRALMIVGHNEYWSDEMCDGVDRYLADGGRVAALSGNTICWRVTFDRDLGVIESRKTTRGEDVRWLSPDEWGERWHTGTLGPGGEYRLVGRPGWRVLGLDTQGMLDDGTPTSFSALTVVQPEHFLFHEPEEVPITAAGTIGEESLNGPKASGYEFDVRPELLGLHEGPVPGMALLASAQDQLNFDDGLGFRSPDAKPVRQGTDVVYWERPRGGVVFNAASIALTGAMARDAGVSTLVRNVLRHFGVAQRPA
jgi:N,N-dimethylformamidase beta subunit-like, C-terminal/Concanavalin A-like lectin/glucanases superfamily